MEDNWYHRNDHPFPLIRNHPNVPNTFRDGGTPATLPSTPMPSIPFSSEDFLRDDPWVVPLIATSAVNIVTIFAFEVFFVVKALQGTPSRRHFFMGQCLIAGLVLMSLSGGSFALQPSLFACNCSRVLIGLSPAIVFGALLVKCVFLTSLHAGVYLPAYYQGLLLFFIVLVQGAITIQWMATKPTLLKFVKFEDSNELHISCESTYKNFMISLFYIMVLILMVAVFSIKCRRIRSNYRESSYIGFSLCVIVPLWLVWSLTGLVLPVRVQPACLGFGSVVTASIVFLVMFVPKGRQWAAGGQNGLFDGDRHSSSSSLSSCATGDEKYAPPSFFVFQPVKASVPAGVFGARSTGEDSIFKTNISASPCSSGIDEGIYDTISPIKNDSGIASNPNFYLFKSHSNIEMMY